MNELDRDLISFIEAHQTILSTSPLPVSPERGLELLTNKVEEVARTICLHYQTAFPDDENKVVPIEVVRRNHAAAKALEIHLASLKSIQAAYQDLVNKRN